MHTSAKLKEYRAILGEGRTEALAKHLNICFLPFDSLLPYDLFHEYGYDLRHVKKQITNVTEHLYIQIVENGGHLWGLGCHWVGGMPEQFVCDEGYVQTPYDPTSVKKHILRLIATNRWEGNSAG